MIKENKQKYLVPKTEMLFLKEAQSNKSVYAEYGWKNTGTLFKAHLLNYLIEFLKEVVEEDIDYDGVITKKHYGVRRIPDAMAMVEMLAYADGVNVDRLVTLAALIAFVKLRESNVNTPVKIENQIGTSLENPQNFSKLKSTGFRNIGRGNSGSMGRRKRNPFKNIG